MRKDLTGQKIGKLLVLECIGVNKRQLAVWRCICDCGNTKLVTSVDLTHQRVRSCGCLQRESCKLNIIKPNTYTFKEDICVVTCTNKNISFVIDAEDYDKIKSYTWGATTGNHISTSYRQKTTPLTNIILGIENIPNGYMVDHIDRNVLNNRKSNLRICSKKMNNMNRSLLSNNTTGIMGVYHYNNKPNKWYAKIGFNHKSIHLGTFYTKEDAIVARLKAEKQYFGEFAPQRHLFEKYNI